MVSAGSARRTINESLKWVYSLYLDNVWWIERNQSSTLVNNLVYVIDELRYDLGNTEGAYKEKLDGADIWIQDFFQEAIDRFDATKQVSRNKLFGEFRKFLEEKQREANELPFLMRMRNK